MRLFISIAAYRDPELVPTVEDCLAKARHPDRLRFGICWQRGDEEGTLPFADDRRFRVLEVPWEESQGACWARAKAMQLYDGEEGYLQIDSHHRFVANWDEKLVAQLARAESAKPIITTYPAPFIPGTPESFGVDPLQIVFDRFRPDGLIVVKPESIPGWQERSAPVRARFAAAGFLFTTGDFVETVPYDPELYFVGEEITLTVRAFTSGYDLFHPHEIILWHEYTREYRAHKHWSDHVAGQVPLPWFERDRVSLARVQQFLTEPWVGRYGLGAVRTFQDYEAYAGVSFRHRTVQDYTRAHLEPPNSACAANWAECTRQYDVEITLERSQMREADWAFWFVGFHDDSGREIFRSDADRKEIDHHLADSLGAPIRIRRSFESQAPPAKWIIWPHSRAGEWLERLEGDVWIQP